MAKDNITPPAPKETSTEVKLHGGKYTLKREAKGIVNTGIGTIDLANITEKQCEKLVNIKVKWLTKNEE